MTSPHSCPRPQPTASVLPSGEKTKPSTSPLSPRSVCFSSPVTVSHNLTLRSLQPVAKVLPSGEKATQVNLGLRREKLICSLRVAASHNFTVRSSTIAAKDFPSWEKTAEETFLCPARTARSVPVSGSQNR